MITELLTTQRSYFHSGATLPYDFRYQKLSGLEAAIRAHEKELIQALYQDLRKSEAEAFLGEIAFLYEEIDFAKKNLKEWMSPKRVSTPLVQAVGKSEIWQDPLGVVLIISPWNYPVNLALSPLIAAIAAGNTAVIKPSELAPHTSTVLTKAIQSAFNTEFVASVEGGVEVSSALLKERWDHIFFTGSTAVGKVVMKAAANFLTPVTLELGGKSPCIFDSKVNESVAVRRMVWGKFFNAGQTCVAPDYLMIPKGTTEKYTQMIAAQVKEFYGEDPKLSPDFARIINGRHYERLEKYLKDGQVVMGGKTEAASRYISPTLMTGAADSAPVMQEEIFGPILPIIEYDSLDQAMDYVSCREKPLALYFFSEDKERQGKLLNALSFGGGCINDTLVHLGNPGLPFGGVGASGMGAYHGRYGFETFSHAKAVVRKSSAFDLWLRYPPYADKLKWLKRFIG